MQFEQVKYSYIVLDKETNPVPRRPPQRAFWFQSGKQWFGSLYFYPQKPNPLGCGRFYTCPDPKLLHDYDITVYCIITLVK